MKPSFITSAAPLKEYGNFHLCSMNQIMAVSTPIGETHTVARRTVKRKLGKTIDQLGNKNCYDAKHVTGTCIFKSPLMDHIYKIVCNRFDCRDSYLKYLWEKEEPANTTVRKIA